MVAFHTCSDVGESLRGWKIILVDFFSLKLTHSFGEDFWIYLSRDKRSSKAPRDLEQSVWELLVTMYKGLFANSRVCGMRFNIIRRDF